MPSPDLLNAALAAWAADCSVIPVRPGTDKAPAVAWKDHQARRAEPAELDAWFRDGTLGLGIITGDISGRLELLELEAAAMPHADTLTQVMDGSGLADTWTAITTGWVEQSPSGGIHWLYRITPDDQPMPRNTKIARTSAGQVLAETRSEAGYFVAAPTPGEFHATGRPWELVHGGPSTIPTITRDERDAIHSVIRAVIDETVAPEPALNPIWTPTSAPARDGDTTPGDDFEAKTSWAEILEPHGWTIVTQHGDTTYWRRPGKTEGISATTGHAQDRDRLYVFSSSTDFPQEVPTTKLGAHAILNHRGDHSAAARDLHAKGFGRRAERHLKAVEPAREIPTNTPNTDGALALNPATITSDADQLTDVGNTHLTRDTWRGRLTYIPDAKRWAEWTGTRWEWRPDDAPALQAALATIDAIPTDNPELAQHRKRSKSARALGNIVAILRTEPTMRTPARDFDAHPLQLNTPDGVIDLTTGDTTAAHPHLYHSKQTTSGTGGAAPKWEAFITWAMGGDADMIAYLQRLVGVSLIGETREHVLPFLHGKGKNGKSVFLETIAAVLGDYATEAPNNLLLKGPDRHPTELSVLQGRRFVTMSEINEGAQFDEAKLKWLTGGDTITARLMRGDFFTFQPTHTLWLAANHKPKVNAGGDGFWRRVRIIPWEKQVADEDRNENLKTELIEEAAGIIAWALAGLADYLDGGLRDPQRVLAATTAYSEEEDHLGRFIADMVHVGGGAHVRTQQPEFRTAYRAWCRTEGEEELNATQLGRELKARFGIETGRSHGKRFYVGVTLLHADEEDTEDGRAGQWNDR